MNRPNVGMVVAMVLACPATARAEAAPVYPNVLVNGGFELDADRDSRADGWRVDGLASRVDEKVGDGHWALALAGSESSPLASATQRVQLPSPPPPVVTVACLLRSTALQATSQGDAAAKLWIGFLDADGQPVRKPKAIGTFEKEVGWRPWSGLVRIPPTTAELELTVMLSGATGQVMFDDVRLFWELPDDFDLDNLVVDGGFEYVNGWSPWVLEPKQKVIYPGRHGHGALKLSASLAGRVAGAQRIVLPEGVERLAVSASVKTEELAASEPGGGVWLQLAWEDALGRPVGAPARLGPWTETGGRWTDVEEHLLVPEGAEQAEVSLALEEAVGAAWIDDLRLEANGTPVARPAANQTDVDGWTRFAPVEGALGAALDAGRWLDAPAGTHGVVRAQEGRFLFEDGTPVSFFGVNLDGAPAFPTHADADALAERLAQLGVNLVRLHHLDAANADPNLFDPAFDDTRHFSADGLDRLDYLAAQLKARGIYLYVDLLVSRTFKAGDDVPAWPQLGKGAKVAALFHPRLIELQQEYARALLTHVNPYTGARWADDPAVALIDIVNENSISRFPNRLDQVPEPYQEELQRQWVAWLTEQGASPAAARAQSTRVIDHPEDPQVQRFFADLQMWYGLRMRAFLRSIGVRAPIAGSNLGKIDPSGLDLWTNRFLDFVDGHGYWDPPRSGVGDLTKFHNRSLITAPADGEHPLPKLARLRVWGTPLVVSEWNIDWPNEFRAVGPLLLAAYARFQEWNGLVQFRFDGHAMADQIVSNFDVSNKPELWWQLPVAATLFHRRDVRPSAERRLYPIRPDPEIPAAMALVHGVRRQDGAAVPAAESLQTPWRSDTEELHWDPDAQLASIDTPMTQAVLGRVGGAEHALSDARFVIDTPFAVVALTSLDDRPLADSRRMLLLTVGRSENTGTVYNATRTMLRTSGQGPILLEPIQGRLELAASGRPTPTVFALDAAGRRQHTVDVTTDGDAVTIPLGAAHLYELDFTTDDTDAPSPHD
jgi:hypothetical protein